MKHKHHDCINAWNAGAVIEFLGADDYWHITNTPQWDLCTEYRIGENSMKQQDLTNYDMLARQTKNDRTINGQHPAKYAAYFIFWLAILSSIMGAVT